MSTTIYVDDDGHFVTAIIAGAVIGALASGAQTDWDPQAMLTGAVIGGVSGGVGGQLGGAVLGGAAAGTTAGGMSASIYGGNMGQAMLKGAVWGGIGGFAFGSIGNYFGDSWSPGRILSHGLAGGVLADAQGGDFALGFGLAAAPALAMKSWQMAKKWTNKSSLKGDGVFKGSYNEHGELETAGIRKCVGNCDQNLITSMGEMSPEGAYENRVLGIPYRSNSSFGRFVNQISKVHDWMNGWGYKGTGNYIARGYIGNTAFSIYSATGMLPAAIYTGFAFSANAYQPVLY